MLVRRERNASETADLGSLFAMSVSFREVLPFSLGSRSIILGIIAWLTSEELSL